jgi:flagellum-specific peptidoglycan hydrolase FlgJ
MTPTPEVIGAAQNAERKWGVPASITIAQYGLESGWGVHMPAGSNNPFGIKASANQPSVLASTKEYVNGKPIPVNAYFRKFDSLSDAFEAHAELLQTSKYYARARMYEHPGEDDQFAGALTGVYATDPNYGSLLTSIIRSGNLTQYDVWPHTTSIVVAQQTTTTKQPWDPTQHTGPMSLAELDALDPTTTPTK